MTTKLQTKKGFTIVETLVAIAILMLALTGPLLIISQALRASFYSRDQVTAFYLAQEAVEYIRNIRDQTSLSPNVAYYQWLDDITRGDACNDATRTCVNRYQEPVEQYYKFNIVHTGANYEFVGCGGATCAPLSYEDLSLVEGTISAIPYGGSETGSSKFTRTIWLSTVPGDDRDPGDDTATPVREVMIHVEITWKQGTNNNRFVLESHLLNWKLEK